MLYRIVTQIDRDFELVRGMITRRVFCDARTGNLVPNLYAVLDTFSEVRTKTQGFRTSKIAKKNTFNQIFKKCVRCNYIESVDGGFRLTDLGRSAKDLLYPFLQAHLTVQKELGNL